MLARVDIRPRNRGAGRPDIKSAPAFLQWLRGRTCHVHGLPVSDATPCRGKVRACHVDYAGDKGVGTKVSDRFAIPMCDAHHAEQTDKLGWGPFETKYRFDALSAAGEFWRLWPGRLAWERSRDR